MIQQIILFIHTIRYPSASSGRTDLSNSIGSCEWMFPVVGLALFIISLNLSAGNIQEAFLKGNAAYGAGRVDEALKLYQSMEPKGPAVWYNLGNCYYCLGNYPQAIISWRRAQKDSSWADCTTLESYIAQSYEALGIAHQPSFMMRMYRWVLRVAQLFSLFSLQLLFLLCLFLLLYVVSRIQGSLRYSMAAMLSALMIVTAVLSIFNYREQQYPHGIVTKNSISVYAGPGSDYARLTEAKILDTVRVYQVRDGWLHVYIDQFGYGWIEAVDVAMI